jgi:hypothetical protein
LTVFVQNVGSIIKTCHNWFKSIITRFSKFIVNLPVVKLIPLLLAKLQIQSLVKPSKQASSSNKYMFYLRLLAVAGILLVTKVSFWCCIFGSRLRIKSIRSMKICWKNRMNSLETSCTIRNKGSFDMFRF